MGVVWQKWAWSPKIFRCAPHVHSFKRTPLLKFLDLPLVYNGIVTFQVVTDNLNDSWEVSTFTVYTNLSSADDRYKLVLGTALVWVWSVFSTAVLVVPLRVPQAFLAWSTCVRWTCFVFSGGRFLDLCPFVSTFVWGISWRRCFPFGGNFSVTLEYAANENMNGHT